MPSCRGDDGRAGLIVRPGGAVGAVLRGVGDGECLARRKGAFIDNGQSQRARQGTERRRKTHAVDGDAGHGGGIAGAAGRSSRARGKTAQRAKLADIVLSDDSRRHGCRSFDETEEGNLRRTGLHRRDAGRPGKPGRKAKISVS